MAYEEIVGVAGGGLMGVGIATRFALAGHAVVVVEPDAQRAAGIPAVAAGILAELLDAGVIDRAHRDGALARLRVAGALDALAGAALVIEAIPEVLATKQLRNGLTDSYVSCASAVLDPSTSGLSHCLASHASCR